MVALAAVVAVSLVSVPGATGAPPPGDRVAPVAPYLDDSGAYSFAERAADLVSRMTLDEKITQLVTHTAAAIPRLSVPSYMWGGEANHGLQGANPATSFPVALGLGSTWNPDLVGDVATAVSDEARAYFNYGTRPLTYWAPTVNLSRDPRWGRADESYGEDPFLTGQVAGEYVKGLQGDDATYVKVVSTPKHFFANNNEMVRYTDTSDISESQIREYYLQSFQPLVEDAGAQGIMTAYNRVNGVPMSANTEYVTDVARRTWGFDGYITSDCGAIDNITNDHRWQPEALGTEITKPQATAWSIKAGTDIDCMGTQYASQTSAAIAGGWLTEQDVDIALQHLFLERMRLGMFDSADKVPFSSYTREDVALSGVNLPVATQVAEEAIVLLKNEPDPTHSTPILPLNAADAASVVVLGPTANTMTLGGYSADGVLPIDCANLSASADCNNPRRGIQEAVAQVTGGSGTFQYIPGDNNTVSPAEEDAIRDASTVIVVLGSSREESDETRDRADLNLTRGQAALVARAASLNPRTVAYIQHYNMVNIESFRSLAQVPAILWSSFNGQKQGSAIGRVLWNIDGAEPGGRLPFTWYTHESQLGSVRYDYNLSPHDSVHGRTYQYFDGDVSYPFGHGLSYAQFAYSGLVLSRDSGTADDALTARVTVTNTSSTPGQAVVQLYAASPAADGVTRPNSRLKAFDKVAIPARASRTVRLDLDLEDLWFWDSGADRQVYDTGTWTIGVGPDADPAHQLTAPFELTGGLTRALERVVAMPSGTHLDLERADNVIDANLSAVANDQSFYDLTAVKVTYASLDPSVATVNRAGQVRATGTGITSITATVTADGVTKSTSFPVAVTHNRYPLTDLRVAGTTVPGFDAQITDYAVAAPAGSSAPEVSADADGYTVTVRQAAGVPGEATVEVANAAVPGAATVYTIRFTVSAASVDFTATDWATLADDGWTVSGEHTGWWGLGADGPAIRAERGTMRQGANTAHNVVSHTISDDATLTARLTMSALPTVDHQEAFLALGDDPDNYVALSYENAGAGAARIVWSSEVGGQWTSTAGPPLTATTVYLRLTRADGEVAAGFSTDGLTFTEVGGAIVQEFINPRVMLGATTGTSSAPVVTAAFASLDVGPPIPITPVGTNLESVDFAQDITSFADLQAAGWTVNTLDPARLSFGTQGMTLTAGTQDWGGDNTFTHVADGNWRATMRIDVSRSPNTLYEQVGIGVTEDENALFKFVYGFNGCPTGGACSVVQLWSTGGGGANVDDKISWAIGPDNTVYLRLTKVGNHYSASVSNNGTDFTLVSQVDKVFDHPKFTTGAFAVTTGGGWQVTVPSLTVEDPTAPPPPPPPAVPLESVDFRELAGTGDDTAAMEAAGWVNARPAAGYWSLTPTGGLTVIAHGGTGLAGSTNGAENLFLHSAPGDWRVTVEGQLPAQISGNYPQAVIGIYQDDDNYLKVVRSGENGGRFQTIWESGGDFAANVPHEGHTPLHYWLRIQRVGDTYSTWYSETDGSEGSFVPMGSWRPSLASTARFMITGIHDTYNPSDHEFQFLTLVVDEPNTAATGGNAVFPDRNVELSQAIDPGLQLATWVAGAESAAFSYRIAPMDKNTAGASVTSSGLLTATRTGEVRVTTYVSDGAQNYSRSAIVRVVGNGTSTMTPVTSPSLALATVYAHVGAPVSIAAGTWSVEPDSVSYQWTADGVAIPLATNETYTPVAGDIGKQLGVVVSAHHGELGDQPAVSQTVAIADVLTDTADLTAGIVAAQAQADAVDPASVTEASWTALTSALTQANGVVSDELATPGAVAGALAALAAAPLIPRGDVTPLSEAITAFESLSAVELRYTAASWARVSNAADAAAALVAAPQNVTSADVVGALLELDAAWAALALAPDVSALAGLSAGVRAEVDSGQLDPAAYTQDSWRELTQALAEAEAAVAVPGSQVAVNGAHTRLLAAVAGLEPHPNASAPDRLLHLLTQVDSLDQADYSPESWARFALALGTAETVAATPPIDRGEAAAAVQALLDGLTGLRGAAVDPGTGSAAGLEALLATIDGLGLNSSEYTVPTWTAFAVATGAARALAAAPSTQAALDAAEASVRQTLAALELVPGPGVPNDPDDSDDTKAPGDDTKTPGDSTKTPDPLVPTVLADLVAQATGARIDAAMGQVTQALGALKAAEPVPTLVPESTQVARVKVAQRQLTLVRGASATIAATGLNAAGVKAKATWASSKASVASVSAAGKITAKKAGTAVVTARAGGKSATVTVRVLAKAPATTTVAKVKATVPRTVHAGTVTYVTGTYTPARALTVKIRYTSSAPSVATIDKYGVLTARAPGSTKITVSAGGKKAVYTLKVTG
jgi:beta-glucosidase